MIMGLGVKENSKENICSLFAGYLVGEREHLFSFYVLLEIKYLKFTLQT